MKSASQKLKVSVTIPNVFVSEVDALVQQRAYPNRSAAFEEAIKQLLRARIDAAIEAEVAKQGRDAEIAEAEEGMEDYSALLKG